jgi:hypothetical protein
MWIRKLPVQYHKYNLFTVPIVSTNWSYGSKKGRWIAPFLASVVDLNDFFLYGFESQVLFGIRFTMFQIGYEIDFLRDT